MTFCGDLLNGKYNIVLFISLFILVFHCYYTRPDKVEPMAVDTPAVSQEVKNAVNAVYSADVEAIRNLSKIATDLTTGGLKHPGKLTVTDDIIGTGKIQTDGDINTLGALNANKGINCNVGINCNGKLNIEQPAKSAVTAIDIKSTTGNMLIMSSSLGAGNYNPIVQEGDKGIIYHDGQPNTGGLFIGPHSDGTKGPKGMRMDNNGNVNLQGSLQIGSFILVDEGGQLVIRKANAENKDLKYVIIGDEGRLKVCTNDTCSSNVFINKMKYGADGKTVTNNHSLRATENKLDITDVNGLNALAVNASIVNTDIVNTDIITRKDGSQQSVMLCAGAPKVPGSGLSCKYAVLGFNGNARTDFVGF